MSSPSDILVEARRAAGLTQSELAARMGTTQTAVARMERRGSNPTVSTLARALRAAGRQLELSSTPLVQQVDESQIAAHLRMTPAERVRYHEAGYRNMAEMIAGIRRGDG